MIKINYIKEANSITARELEITDMCSGYISINHIIFVSDLLDYILPISGNLVAKYGYIVMVTGNKIFLNENQYNEFISAYLSKIE